MKEMPLMHGSLSFGKSRIHDITETQEHNEVRSNKCRIIMITDASLLRNLNDV